MIPSILHQIYFLREKKQRIPWQWKALSKKSRKYLSHWYYYNWNFENACSLIKEHYAHYMPFFEGNTYEVVIQSDIFRYIVLYHYGGWYMDFDCEITRPLDTWNMHDIVIPLERDQEEGTVRLGNAIIASKKNHPFWLSLLSTIQNTSPPEKQQQYTDAVVAFSGPTVISAVYHSLPEEDKKHMTLPKRKHFHFRIPSLLLPKDYKQLRSDPDVYCIHYTHGLWRQGSTRYDLLKKVLFKNSFSYFFIRVYKKIKSLFVKHT